jgi:hypothetical protein
VTRGFYADVAEALISWQTCCAVYTALAVVPVRPLHPSTKSSQWISMKCTKKHQKGYLCGSRYGFECSSCWFKHHRADKQSGLGVYPRPLPVLHPQMVDVLPSFRLEFGRHPFCRCNARWFMFPYRSKQAFSQSLPSETGARQTDDYKSRIR